MVTHRLNRHELAGWHADGYHIARGLFEPAEVQEAAARFDALASEGTPIPGHWEPNPTGTDVLDRYPRVMQPHEFDPGSQRLFLDPRVRAVLQELLDEDVVGCQTMYYFKPPGARGQAFHQDNYYLMVQPSTCVAAWLAIDRSHPGNGGLQVCPGTHLRDLECPERADLTTSFIDDFVAPPAGHDPVGLELEPGDTLFFTGSVIHGSNPNSTTNEWRRSFISHYMPLSATHIARWYLPHLYDFDGQPVSRASTASGGPCGVVSPSMSGSPH
ncbi:MAG TPA: phytanoyl-CoA dioxygenase family protein [Propionibacteriaceae bacterium]|nr:phytanoyl-CoA dioxygenase family protein [Propionibacteriaceae bacterium]